MTTQTHKPTVLVTGGSGFVGAYVIRDLVLGGYRVKALSRKATVPSFIDRAIFDEVQWLKADVLDTYALADAFAGVDTVIHSAAKVSFRENERTEMFTTNIEGTANVVNAAIESKVRKLIHVSSVAALGKKTNGGMVNEEEKWVQNKFSTNYSVSKYYGEMEVWRGIAEGLNAVIVNPSTILGYGDWNTSSAALFKNVFDGMPWYTNGRTGFVDVEDVSEAILLLMASDVQAERFILSSENWTYRKMLECIASGFGKKFPHREATPFLSGLAWRVEKLRSTFSGGKTLFTKETAKISQSDTRFDNTKILQALPGFVFTPLEETIARACKRYTL